MASGPLGLDRIKRLWTLNSCFNKKQSDWWIHLSAPQALHPSHHQARLALDARLQNWIKFSAEFSHSRSVAHTNLRIFLNYVLYVQYNTATSFRIRLINAPYDLIWSKKRLHSQLRFYREIRIALRKFRIWNRNSDDLHIIDVWALQLILSEILCIVTEIFAFFDCVCVHLLNKISKKDL